MKPRSPAPTINAPTATLAANPIDLAPPLDGGVVPEWVLVLPLGEIEPRGHGKHIVGDAAQANIIIANTLAYLGNTQMMVDYDHTSHANIVGDQPQPAPAAGWVQELVVRDAADVPGIYARIRWADNAMWQIRSMQWRYLSPEIKYDTKTKQILCLCAISLVNRPALDLALFSAKANNSNLQTTMKENAMTSEQLAALAASLNLPATATADEIIAATAKLSASQQAAPVSPVIPASDADLTAKLAAAEKSLSEANSKLAAAAAIDAAAQVDTAILAGKITPAERETMLKFATASPDAFGEYVKNKTAHTVLSATSAGATPSATVTATLSQVDKDVAAKLGISEEEFAKQKAADQAKGV